jgi:hypothetical protein
MNLSQQLAKNFRDVHFGGNWTASNMKDNLAGITWQQATAKVESFNTIAVLVYHINYYVSATLKVLQGEPLKADDKYSFDLPPIHSQHGWEALLNKTWTEAEEFAALIEQLPESRLWENLADEKYGTYYRNIQGIIEHTHYHLGQIAILKKMVVQSEKTEAEKTESA